MSETYIVLAKTVDEAMEIAQREYGGEGKEISFDILEMPKKGFLGIGAKEAKIKVTVTESEDISLDSIVAEMRRERVRTTEDTPAKKEKPQQKKDPSPAPQKDKPQKGSGAPGKTDKPAPKAEKAQAPAQKSNAQHKAAEKAPVQKEAKPAKESTRAHSESHADGRLDTRPEYKTAEIRGDRETPRYKETGAKVKSYKKNDLQIEAKADGIIDMSAPLQVKDVRWDSAPKKDLGKTAENTKPAKDTEALWNAIAAAADGGSVKRTITDTLEDRDEGEYSIDAAIDAAIEAAVEEMPAPETRKKVGVTAVEMEHAVSFVNTLLVNMQIDAKAVAVACPEGEEYEIEGDANLYPAIEIVGEGTGLLIGHHGETMDAIQYLLNLAAIRHSENPNGDYVKITLDIENYRAKREETLRSLARRMAQRALKYRRNVFLEPMNAYERRIIHSELQSVPNVSTHSVGADKNRKIIITYEGPDKQPDKPKSRKGEEHRGGKQDRPARHSDGSAEAVADVRTEAGKDEQAPAGEKKSRNRHRRPRHRRSGGAARSGADAIITDSAELEEVKKNQHPAEKQVVDPTPKSEDSLPAFLRTANTEPDEHLREN